MFREGKILLVRENDGGTWSAPGGWADVGESPSDAAVRETTEESGYQTKAVKLISALDRDRHGHPPLPYHVYKLVYLCELVEHTPSSPAESGAGFFGEDEIPALSLSRVTPAQVSRFFEHHRNQELPADFD